MCGSYTRLTSTTEVRSARPAGVAAPNCPGKPLAPSMCGDYTFFGRRQSVLTNQHPKSSEFIWPTVTRNRLNSPPTLPVTTYLRPRAIES